MFKDLNKETLSSLLEGPLPGEEAQLKMAPEIRRGRREEGKKGGVQEGKSCRHAAVMILVYRDDDSYRTVFMKRNEYDGPHSGQISFPGGMFEDEDGDLKQTAIRETAEEIGISEKEIEVLGELTPLYIPISNFCVTPFIGWLQKKPVFAPDDSEVQYLLTPAIEGLFDPSHRREERLFRHERDILAPAIQVGQDIIWGATAMILSEFMELIVRQ